MKTLKFTVKNLADNRILICFPELENSTIELYSGGHINSKNNWSKFVPHGNSKKESRIFEIEKKTWRDFQVCITDMTKIDETKYPNQNKYRLVVSGDFGVKGYITTGEIRLNRNSFIKLTNGLTPSLVKNNFIQYEL